MTLRRWASAISLSVLFFSACHHSLQESDRRSEEQQALYDALNDSMLHLMPQALTQIQAQKQQAPDSLTWYDYHLMYGRHYLLTQHPDSLLPYVQQTLQFLARHGADTRRTRGMEATALNAKASYYLLLRHHPDTIIHFYQKAYDLMSNSDMQEKLPDLSANLADAYVARNDLPNASRWYRRALLLADSLGLPPEKSLTLYMGLGRIYTSLRDFEQARQFYEHTDAQIEKLKPNMQAYFLNNYGNYFYYKHEYQQALSTFRRLKAHLHHYHADGNFDMFLCKVNMADVFLNLHQTDSATIYLNDAEAYFRQKKISEGIYYAQTIRMGIALEEGRHAEIREILKEDAVKDCVVDENLKMIRRNYLNKYYAAIGDYQKAYKGLQGHLVKQDSTDDDNRRMRSSDIMIRLTEDTIRLHHQLALKASETSYAKTRLFMWITLTILTLFILLFILWLNLMRRRRLQANLDMLTLRLANARQRITPHFIFNVLNSRISHATPQETDQLMSLAHLIRSNLDISQQPCVTLAEELDFVSQYVAIEQSLMGESFTFTLDTPERDVLEQVQTPSMLVQILTENAILHGLKNQPGHKELTIKVEVAEKETRVFVCDNGPGFDIRCYNSERSRTGLNIIRTTVAAINQRNKKCKMSFNIVNENGCHAILTIPKDIKIT